MSGTVLDGGISWRGSATGAWNLQFYASRGLQPLAAEKALKWDALMLDTPNEEARGPAKLAPKATPSEVSSAIEALTPAELLRLRSYARFRMRALSSAGIGRNHEDLMSEAITATLAGTRRWNKEAVDMTGHLAGVMRSLSSHWSAQVATAGEGLVWQGAVDEGTGERAQVAQESPAVRPDAERELAARQEVERIRRYFVSDELVLRVIGQFEQGLRGPDIKQALGLSQKQYETVLKRLRRGVERMQRRGEDHVN